MRFWGAAAPKDDARFKTVGAEQLQSNVYKSYSNYVHAKYPEAMDLYGGMPEHFHVRGMLGTSKDDENVEIIDTFITTVELTFRLMIWKLNLHSLIEVDPYLASWLRSKQLT